MLFQTVGDINASEVSKGQINQLLLNFSTDLKKRGKPNHKVNAMLRCLKALFNYGIKVYELSSRNPCVGLEYYSVDRKLKYIPSDEQIQAVKEICDPDQKMLFEFLEQTGARINEALRLTGDDVFNDYVILYTRKSKNSDLVPRKVPKPTCFCGLTFEGRVFKVWTFYPEFLKRKVRKLKQPY